MGQILPSAASICIYIILRRQNQGDGNSGSLRQGLTLAVGAFPVYGQPLVIVKPVVVFREVVGATHRAQLYFPVDFTGLFVGNDQFATTGVADVGEDQTRQSVSTLVIERIALR